MPFRSEAQRRLFYGRKDLRRYIPEFEAATGKKKLPKKIKKSKKKAK